MTQFDKTKFHGATLVHYSGSGEYRFVARFKYGGKAAFLKFLAENFTVEEYFQELDKGTPPLRIVEARGYVQPHVKKILKAEGYPQTPAGMRQYIAESVIARRAA
jgi:hypothetical protein